MCGRESKSPDGAEKAAGCGCAPKENGHGCPCNPRVCLPIMGLVGASVLAALVVKSMRSRSRSRAGGA